MGDGESGERLCVMEFFSHTRERKKEERKGGKRNKKGRRRGKER